MPHVNIDRMKLHCFSKQSLVFSLLSLLSTIIFTHTGANLVSKSHAY